MLHNDSSISTYSTSNKIIWFALAFQAGTINIGGFMTCHRFVSHVTGFATFFSYELNQSKYVAAIGMLAVPILFLIGSMISALLVDLPIQKNEKPKYHLSFGFIFLLLALVLVLGVAGQLGPFGESTEINTHYFLLATLCLACGIQNGMITSVSRSIIRTTHLTGITTDLGIGVIRVLNKKYLSESKVQDEQKANFVRSMLILSFILGCVCGGYFYSHWQYLGFAIPVMTSGTLFLVMLYFKGPFKSSTLPVSQKT